MMRMLMVLLVGGMCFNAVAVSAASPQPAATAAQQAAREEIIRRQDAQLSARRLIDQAQMSYKAGNYQDATAKLENAVKLLPHAKLTDADRSRALRLLSDSCYQMADNALRSGDTAQARALAQKSLEFNPNNSLAEGVIVKVKKAEAAAQPGAIQAVEAPDKTPEFIAKKDQIKKLFREGKIMMNSGQYDEAEQRFQQILLLDPYNEDASVLLKSVAQARTEIAGTASDAARSRSLEEVAEAWVPPISRDIQAPKSQLPATIDRDAARQAALTEKLNKIIIPEVNYREAVVSDVITFLSEESRRLDPDKTGVNIVLGAGVSAPAVAPTAPPATGGAENATEVPPSGEGLEGRKITLSLRDVPLIDALKYVTTLADLKYRIESSAVIVLPTNAPSGDMITRAYPVNPGAFIPWINPTNRPTANQQTVNTGGGGAGASASSPLIQAGPSFALPDTGIAVDSSNQVRQVFANAGVEFPPGSAFFYYDRTSTIVIRNTPENLETFDRVLAVINATPSQVEIETKFVEISQNDLDELGFQWNVGQKMSGSFLYNGGNPPTDFDTGAANPNYNSEISGGLRTVNSIAGNAVEALLAAQGFGSFGGVGDTVGTVKGILTNPQFQVVILALAQKKSADVLSAPKLTTISGAQAQIRVAQEFIYPTTFTPATVTPGTTASAGGAATQPVVAPATPSAFASRPVGVVFNVTPMVGADGYTINLTLIPQLTDFLGFINYGNTIQSGNIAVPNDIKQPLFSTRDMVTSVQIWDGQTVVLGGLIREDVQKIDDKIPFLGDIPGVGRLFRSKVEQRNKRNLLIFVTARLIDPAGNPVHRTRTEAASLR